MARKFIILLAVFFIVLNVMMVVAVLLRGQSTPSQPRLPDPNGYEDFVKAGVLEIGEAWNADKMSHDELATLLATNSAALKLVHEGLTKECRVPVGYSPDHKVTNSMAELGTFRQTGWLLCAEGRLAELDRRTNDAALRYLDNLRFSQAICRGGFLTSRMIGIACEAPGLNHLQSMESSMDATNSATVAKALEALDQNEEPFSEILAREKTQFPQPQSSLDTATRKDNQATLQRREIMLAFAAQAYELEKGKRPANVAELVPDYLKEAPKNPTTGKELELGR